LGAAAYAAAPLLPLAVPAFSRERSFISLTKFRAMALNARH
jgi:hypothetical protein